MYNYDFLMKKFAYGGKGYMSVKPSNFYMFWGKYIGRVIIYVYFNTNLNKYISCGCLSVFNSLKRYFKLV